LAHTPIPLAKAVVALACVGLAVSGASMIGVFKSAVGRLMLLYTGWLILNVPFAVWRGGAFEVLLVWTHSFICFVVIASLISNFSQLRKSLFIILLAIVAIILAGLVLGNYVDGRFGILKGTLQNANELAIHLLLILPFSLFFLADSRSSVLTRILGALSALAILGMALSTGSRTGLLMMAAFGLAMFAAASLANKVKILIAGTMIAVLALGLLPADVRLRYTALFTDKVVESDSSDVLTSAAASAALRELLFEYSLRMALEHPIFGVGMGNFSSSAQVESEKEHESTQWKQPHNVYTQLAAETGIVGLLLYLAILLITVRICWRVRKATRGKPALSSQHLMAGCLILTLLAYTVSNIFATNAYSFYLPVFAALAFALDRYSQQAWKPVPAPVLPPWVRERR
jgi:putative inorganic carbon (HCO3(-)) transporter